MILITGDIHGSHDLYKIERLDKKILTPEDYLIILGDAAIIWHGNDKDLEIQKWYKRHLPCKILYIDGNHENFAALNSPVKFT